MRGWFVCAVIATVSGLNVTAQVRDDVLCAGGGDGDYSALTRNLVSNGAASSNGLSLASGFYDGILGVSVTPSKSLAKIFALFEPGSLLGVTEDFDIEDSRGGMAWKCVDKSPPSPVR